MPQPTRTDVHINTALTNIALAYKNAKYIGMDVFPKVPVNHKSDYYYIFTKGDWFRDEAGLVAPGAKAPEGGYTVSSATYTCEVYGWTTPVYDQVKANADSVFRLEAEAVEFSTDKILLKIEREVASLLFTSSNWANSTTLSGTSQWSDYSNSDPFGNLRTAIETVHKSAGVKPNTIVMGQEVWNKLADHPDLLDRVKYSERGIVGPELLAAALGVDRVLIGEAVYNTAAEGATTSMSFIWGKHCWVGYVPPAPGIRVPAAGYTFWWKAYGVAGVKVTSWRDEDNECDKYRAEAAFDVKVVGSDLGYLIVNAVA